MNTEQKKMLSLSPVFRGLEVKQIEEILQESTFQVKQYTKGHLIAQSGSSCSHARIVLSGKVTGEMMDLSGKVLRIEDIEVSKMIAPAFLYGKNKHYPVNVVAIEDTALWQMHRDDFTKLLQKESVLLNNFLNAISNRAQFLSEKIRFLSFPTLKAKIAFLIIRNMNKNAKLELAMTHQQMSELFGVARPSLSREIRRMHEEGYIVAKGNSIQISDLKALRSLLVRN